MPPLPQSQLPPAAKQAHVGAMPTPPSLLHANVMTRQIPTWTFNVNAATRLDHEQRSGTTPLIRISTSVGLARGHVLSTHVLVGTPIDKTLEPRLRAMQELRASPPAGPNARTLPTPTYKCAGVVAPEMQGGMHRAPKHGMTPPIPTWTSVAPPQHAPPLTLPRDTIPQTRI